MIVSTKSENGPQRQIILAEDAPVVIEFGSGVKVSIELSKSNPEFVVIHSEMTQGYIGGYGQPGSNVVWVRPQ